MRKRNILALLVAACSLGAHADDFNYLTATLNSREQSVLLASVQKITFEDDNVVVYTNEGSILLPISEMQKLSFTAEATAVKSLALESNSLSVSGGVIRVNGKGLLRIFNSGGQLVGLRKVDGSQSISADGLPHGLYIMQLGNETIKFTR